MPIGGNNRLREYYFEVGLNQIEGHRRFVGNGNNPDVDTASVPENAWAGGGLYPWIPMAGSYLEMISDSTQDGPSGTGIATYRLTLLDMNYNEVTIDVTLSGSTSTAVAVSGGPYIRINDARKLTKGSGAPEWRATNVGNVSIRDSGGGTVRGLIAAGRGNLRQCIYTIPAGYTGEVISMFIGFNRGAGGGTTRYMTASSFIQSPDGTCIYAIDISCDGEVYRHDFTPGIFLPQKTDFALEIISCSSDNSDITCAFQGIMKLNSAAI